MILLSLTDLARPSLPRQPSSSSSLPPHAPRSERAVAASLSPGTPSAPFRARLPGALAATALTAAVASARRRQDARGARRASRRCGRVALNVNRGDVQVALASGGELRYAAELSARSLRFTKWAFDTRTFSDSQYMALTSEVEQVFSNNLSDNRFPSTFLVAKDVRTGKVIGCISVRVAVFDRFSGDQVSSRRYDGGRGTYLRAMVADFAVDPDCRGKGIGRMLADRSEELVKEWGFPDVFLFVEATNFQARGVYAKMGYRLNGITFRKTQYLDVDGDKAEMKVRWATAIVLRKSMQESPWGALENSNWGPPVLFAAIASYLYSEDRWVQLLKVKDSMFGAMSGLPDSAPLDKLLSIASGS